MNEQDLYSLMVPPNQYRYWYSRLSREHQEMYDKILKGYFEFKERLELPGTIDELQQMIAVIDKDVPETFFVSRKANYSDLRTNPPSLIYYPQYRFTKDETVRRYKEALEESDSFISETRKIRSDQTRRNKLYEYLMANTKYNEPQKARAHEFYYVLAKHSGVCEGISKAVKFLADRIGIRSIVVFGRIKGRGLHAWNVIELETGVTHMDATFGACSKSIRYRDMSPVESEATGHVWHCTLPGENERMNNMTSQGSIIYKLKNGETIKYINGRYEIPRGLSGDYELDKPAFFANFGYEDDKHRMTCNVQEAHEFNTVSGLKWQTLHTARVGAGADTLSENGSLPTKYWLLDKWDTYFSNQSFSSNVENEKICCELYPLRVWDSSSIPAEPRTLFINLMTGCYDEYTYKSLMNDIRGKYFGIEIEGSGMTISKAAEVLAQALDGRIISRDGAIPAQVKASTGVWEVKYDSSINAVDENGQATSDKMYRVEVVTPKLTYASIEILQNVVRKLRENGFRVNQSCGLHIHVDMKNSTKAGLALHNLLNLTYMYQDIFFHAFATDTRRSQFCKKLDRIMIKSINNDKNCNQISCIKANWYKDYANNARTSRYQMLNLHSYFCGTGIEYRLFNGTLHAGIIRAEILFCLAMVNLAERMTHTPDALRSNGQMTERNQMRHLLDALGIILDNEDLVAPRRHLLKYLPTMSELSRSNAS